MIIVLFLLTSSVRVIEPRCVDEINTPGVLVDERIDLDVLGALIHG